MKTDALAKVLNEFAALFRTSRSDRAADCISCIAALLPGAAEDYAKWAARLQQTEGLQTRTEDAGERFTTVESSSLLTACAAMLHAHRQKSASTVQHFAERLRRFPEATLSQIMAAPPQAKKPLAAAPAGPVRIDVVETFLKRLETALGDDAGFTSVLAQLSEKSRVNDGELAVIAKRFTLHSTKTRAASLKKIQARHDSLMLGRAKTEATRGRVAG